MTQEQVGERFHPQVSKSTISRWESAGPRSLTRGVIEAYAEALNRPVEDMYRQPAQGPSLDAKAAELELDPKVIIGVMEAMRGRRTA